MLFFISILLTLIVLSTAKKSYKLASIFSIAVICSIFANNITQQNQLKEKEKTTQNLKRQIDDLKTKNIESSARLTSISSDKQQLKKALTEIEEQRQKERAQQLVKRFKNWVKPKVDSLTKPKPTSPNKVTPFKEIPPYLYSNNEKGYKIDVDAGLVQDAGSLVKNEFADTTWAYADIGGYGLIICENATLVEGGPNTLIEDQLERFRLLYEVVSKDHKIRESTSRNGEIKFLSTRVIVKAKGVEMEFHHTCFNHYGNIYQILSWSSTLTSGNLNDMHQKMLNSFSAEDVRKHNDGFALTSSYTGWRLHFSKKEYNPIEDADSNLPGNIFSTTVNSLENFVIYEYQNSFNLTKEQLLKGCLCLLDHSNPEEYKYSEQKIDDYTISVVIAPYEIDGVKYQTEVNLLEKDKRVIFLVSYYEQDEHYQPLNRQLWNHFEWLKIDPEYVANEDSLQLQATTSNQIALALYNEGDYLNAEKLFSESMRLEPSNPIYARNRVHSLRNLGEYGKALTAIKKSEKIFKNDKDLQVFKAKTFIDRGELEKGFSVYEKLFLEGHNDEDDLYAFLDVILKTQPDRAVKVLDSYLDKYPSLKIKVWKSSALIDAERYDESIKFTQEEILSESPNHVKALKYLIEAHQYNKSYKKALKYLTKLSKIEKGSVSNKIWKANILRQQNKHQESYNLLSTLSKEHPENFKVKNALSKASAALGLGDHALLRNKIEPVLLSEKLEALRTKHSQIPAENESESDYYTASRIITQHIEESGKVTKTVYLNRVITKPSAIEYFTNEVISFNPIYEKIYVNSVKISHRGKVSYTGKINDLFISDEDSNLESHSKNLNIPIKSLKVGSTIELTYTVVSWEGEKKVPFDRGWVGSSTATRFVAYAFSGNIKNLTTITSLKTNSEKDENSLIIWNSKLPNSPSERLSPPWDRRLPRLTYGDSRGSWKAVSKEYYEHIEKRLKNSDNIDKAIANILDQATTKEEKLRTAIDWVQHTCIYRAIEFGPRGRMPSTVENIIQDRSGDCKDKSLLLCHMLKSLGIECHLALASTNYNIVEKIPSEDQFNHLVLYCPELPHKVIDATVENLNLLKYAPYSLVEDYILPVTQEGHELVKIHSSKDTYRIDSVKNVKLNESEIITTERVKLYGYSASYFRNAFKSRSHKEQHEFIYSLANDYYPDITIDKVEVIAGNDAYEAPFNLKVVYKSTAKSTIPTPFEQEYLRISAMKDRNRRVYKKFPLEINSRLMKSKTLDLVCSNKTSNTAFTSCKLKETDKAFIVKSSIKAIDAEADKFNTIRNEALSAIPQFKVLTKK